MDWQALRAHLLVLLATLCGIVGMGVVYTGVTSGKLGEVTLGVPLLFLGLWWSGIQLGRGQAALRARRAVRAGGRSPDAGPNPRPRGSL